MFACPICKVVVEKITLLRKHIDALHKGALYSSIVCGQIGCPRAFDNFQTLRKHLLVCTFPASDNNDLMECDNDYNCELEPDLQNDQFIKYTECDTSNDVTIDVYDQDEPILTNNVDDTLNECDVNGFDPSVLEHNALLFISEFYANPDISRATVQNIVTGTNSLVSQNLALVGNLLDKLCEGNNISQSAQSLLKSALAAVSNPFRGLETEHLRFKSLLKTGALVKPETFVCGRKGITSLTGEFISLKQTLEKFFELPNVLECVKNYVKSLEAEIHSGVISNFIQGKLWQNKSKEFGGKFVLPIFLHFDDLELGNALGSHNNIHKIGSVTAQCPCLPPEYVSLLENHFPVLLFHSADRSADDPLLEVSNNSIIFNKVIVELNSLRTDGILINTANGPVQLYFDLGLILGDNLGLHSILGLVESFTANFPCMYCKMSKLETECACQENCALLRNVDNYNEDIATNDVSLTGLKEECVFHEVTGFHVTTNYSVDLMHDAFEGFCKYDLVEILYNFIYIEKYLSLELLNNLILCHDYGDVSNKPPLISENDLKEGTIRMSSNEMLVFIQHLPFILGHIIPEDDKYWLLLLYLYDICMFLLCSSIQEASLVYLNYLITQHHMLYVELLGKKLKPKHHHALHYYLVILMCGPPIHFWGMHYESRHRILKRYSNVCFSRVNITLSIALKLSLNTAFRILCQKGFSRRLSMSSTSVPTDKLFLERRYSKDVVSSIKCSQRMFSPKYVICDGIKYKSGTCVILSVDTLGLPEFGIIDTIIINKREVVQFVMSRVQTVSFDKHTRVYHISVTDEFQCLSLSSLPWRKPVFFHKNNMKVSLYHAI